MNPADRHLVVGVYYSVLCALALHGGPKRIGGRETPTRERVTCSECKVVLDWLEEHGEFRRCSVLRYVSSRGGLYPLSASRSRPRADPDAVRVAVLDPRRLAHVAARHPGSRFFQAKARDVNGEAVSE